MSKAKSTKSPAKQPVQTAIKVESTEQPVTQSAPVEPAKPASVAEKKVVPTKPVAAVKPQAKPAVAKEPVKEPVAAEPAKTAKVKKPKLIRDSFTFPESDYSLIAGLKLRALSQGSEFKKSEILRAGLAALNALPDSELLKVLSSVEKIKTGRPSKK